MEQMTSALIQMDGRGTAGLPADPPVGSQSERAVGWSSLEEAWFDRGERGLCTWDHDGRPQPDRVLPPKQRSVLLIVLIADALALCLLGLIIAALP